MWWILIDIQVHLVENQTLFTFKILHQNCTNLLSPSPAQCFVPFIYISILISLNSVHSIFFFFYLLMFQNLFFISTDTWLTWFTSYLFPSFLFSGEEYFLFIIQTVFSLCRIKSISRVPQNECFLCSVQSISSGYPKMNVSSVA